ncbi:MAG: porin, partial [Muribaculaceae bacterium]|nr:porin [Muribaculaceae bacterium]
MDSGFLKGFLVGIAMVCMVAPSVVAEDADVDYKPQIHGTFRGRYENELRDGYGRFQVRNARISAKGMVAPSNDYFMQTDLSAN